MPHVKFWRRVIHKQANMPYGYILFFFNPGPKHLLKIAEKDLPPWKVRKSSILSIKIMNTIFKRKYTLKIGKITSLQIKAKKL